MSDELKIRVATDEEAEKAAFVLCVRKAEQDPEVAAMFPDNVEGPCVSCGETVVWRPYMPAAVPKICFSCVLSGVVQESGEDS